MGPPPPEKRSVSIACRSRGRTNRVRGRASGSLQQGSTRWSLGHLDRSQRGLLKTVTTSAAQRTPVVTAARHNKKPRPDHARRACPDARFLAAGSDAGGDGIRAGPCALDGGGTVCRRSTRPNERPPMTLLEKMAAAIAGEEGPMSPKAQERFIPHAAAALRAIREPDQAVLDAMRNVDFAGPATPDEAAEWRAGIDAILRGDD